MRLGRRCGSVLFLKWIRQTFKFLDSVIFIQPKILRTLLEPLRSINEPKERVNTLSE